MKQRFKLLRFWAAVITAKCAIVILRLFKSGGTSLPGKLALKLYPQILDHLAGLFRVTMITGTNGKTTTSRIVLSMMEQKGLKVITNKSGANLSSGITTTLISALTLGGRPRFSHALLETDEAAFRTLAPRLKPETVIVTNFFRDQLDRYGELHTTVNNVREGISRIPDAVLILNADDSLCASLGRNAPNKVIYFGMGEGIYPESGASINSDAAFCIQCKSRYEYSSVTFGHLGHFRCPSCGYERPHTHVECSGILFYDSLGSHVEISGPDLRISVKLALPGLYNIYNALAGASFGLALGLDEKAIAAALSGFECGFGRMETIAIQDKELKMILVKNPTGFNQVLRYLLTQEKPFVLAFAINDRLADGTDISWLWDVDFEVLALMAERVRNFYVSGIRAEDMAVRLKYAGISTDRIRMEKDYRQLITRALQETGAGETCCILPTYTAMLDIRRILKKQFGLKEFWK
ncbi:MAG TPA: Mur ligase family protein [Thermoclostridium caenicola]|uniref:Lipid II isoglutaminyl synthase (glutamine-hydrolyzing) subunit MurT n=1 Tax=Thermoclostridium caenicola TaxID=659425 RepID=A0A1M6IJM4_9FIRM|nr:Mur ligase family protein [Thermoclostridium caenicola]SHJ34599.1 UDP-N-acetylmuramyl tripeptide synthase [Thermoclostridium caenicola]HOK43094.1 Mur ligase family protein [Thermoclostridium caenicola]HOL85402.1 Mur ligase family protein [Thermoclostridium caenicola]HOP72205.1 Mur ligase family protein [Thermoclostridium caenicola]HPO77190.1 Mur ligase family protein [Thermoclostridium caenicola]